MSNPQDRTSKTSAADPLLRNLREPGPRVDATMLRVCWQAADEIDRLRRELKEMEARAISEQKQSVAEPHPDAGYAHPDAHSPVPDWRLRRIARSFCDGLEAGNLATYGYDLSWNEAVSILNELMNHRARVNGEAVK